VKAGCIIQMEHFSFSAIIISLPGEKILPFIAARETAERGFYEPGFVRSVPTMVNHDLLYEIALNHLQENIIR
jgi:hypothetical protein